MKVGLDLRFLGDDLYSNFVLELIKNLISKDRENKYIIYTNKIITNLETTNYKQKNVGIKNFSFREQTNFLKILKNDKNNVMIFFNSYKPIFYSGNYYTFVSSLKEVYYSNFNSYFKKYIFLYLLEKNLKKSNKIICFDENTKNELIERFNTKEKDINTIEGFFPEKYKLNNSSDIKINLRTKYGLKDEYFIYSAGDGFEKNYEKLVLAFKKLRKNGYNIDLVFLGDKISKNIPLRNLIINNEIQNNIHFLSLLKTEEKILIYKDAIGTIFPSLYEPFPFKLTETLSVNSKIFASNIKSIQKVIGKKAIYFSPISVNSIYETLISNIIKKEEKIDYSDILSIYNKDNTTKQLLEIIN